VIVYISIGNSDDKLTQLEWSRFIIQVSAEVVSIGKLHGAWFSNPAGPYQNCCWCVEFEAPDDENEAKEMAAKMARIYRQDSIAWARVTETEFVS
jgi:hypothetical protein